MMEHTLQSHHSYDLIGPIWRVDRFCSVSIQLKMWFEGRKYICSGPDRLVTNGRQQCQIFFDCVDRALEALFQYASHVDDCNQKFGINNNHSMEYGIETSLKEEYVRKKMFKESFPSHFFGQCSGRIPVVIVDIPYRTKDTVECRRRTDNIIKSIDTLKTCHDFVATCKKIFDCLENLQPCTSVKFGPETSLGFEMENVKNFPYSQEMPPCDHWAVQITVGVHTNNLLCAAKRIFRVKSFEFCESYEWVCQKVLDCLNTREFCIYSPNKATNFGFEEDVRAGILNFQMGEISEKNPRELVKHLYECNKRLGYPHFVHLYFSTVACVEKDVCYTNVFEEEDEEQFMYKRVRLLAMYGTSNPLTVMHSQDRLTMWACKREALSTVTCPEFLKVCDEIRSCLADNATTLNEEASELQHDDTCYSPLPVNTINPNPEDDVGGRGYFPGILGPSLSYTVIYFRPVVSGP